jgi:hypothetical protein
MSESENNDAILSGLAALRRAGVRMVPVEVMKLEELYSENAQLREALEALLVAADNCKIIEVGAGGMSIDAQIARSFYLRVPVCPFEDARAALGVKQPEPVCVNAHDRCYGGAGGPCPLCEMPAAPEAKP